MSTIPSFSSSSSQPPLTGRLAPRVPRAGLPHGELNCVSTDVARAGLDVRLTPDLKFLLPTNIPAGATVMLQGFKPATIDAVLSLTLGRGGRFIQQGVLPRYQPSGQEPACIVIRSRSGRPPLANSAEQFADVVDHFWQPFGRRLKQLRGRRELSLHLDLWPLLSQAASELLDVQGQPTSACQVEHWFRGWSRYRMTRVATARAMIQSAAVASEARPVDVPAALGEVWRRLQADLQPILQSSGCWQAQSAASLPRFTREMERIAGGPPAETIGKLLGLMRCRLLVTASAGDSLADALRWSDQGSHAQALKTAKH